MSQFTAQDHRFMSRAIQLARQGIYTTDPNPRVGCVIVKDDQLIAEGFHQKAGEGHAEVNALRNANRAGRDVRGATAYVTLEPCSHFGRTPPCAQGLIDAGIKRVIAAMVDPNPEVAGRGLKMLQDAGIEVGSGLLEGEARTLNPGFLSRMERGRPFVRLKLAMSLDGRTAMASGESKWITGAEARSDVQLLRARSSAILTGVSSVKFDDSSLTVRKSDIQSEQVQWVSDRQPLRVVLDSKASLPSDAKMLSLAGRTLVVASGQADAGEIQRLISAGAEVHQQSIDAEGGIALEALLQYLAAEESCNELLVETGAKLAGSFLSQGLVDELYVYMAPKLMGSDARPLALLELDEMSEAIDLELKEIRQFGADIRMIWRIQGS